MLPSAYNMNVQIFQTADHVVLLNEMVHNARIIPLDGRNHGTVPQWTGVSRGHWEGDTLVVETKNFLRETSFRNSSKNLHLTERIRRTSEDALLYSFTVEDSTTWTQPWTVELPMRLSDLPIFEYSPREVKKAVVGKGGASKEQVQFMITKLLNLTEVPRPLDASDALAVALCHGNNMTFRPPSGGHRPKPEIEALLMRASTR